MRARAAYEELIRRTRDVAILSSCIELLEWDELTYMPRAGAIHRGDQQALLAGLYHERASDPRIAELLSELECSTLVSDSLSPSAVNVREIRRAYDRITRLPRALFEEMARVTTLAQHEWEAARHSSDFGRFQPWLERVVALKREEAESIGYETIPYDALLDEYEPGARSAEVAQIFTALWHDLIPLVDAIRRSPRQAPVAILRREFPLEEQRALGEAVAAALGFDFARGRLDATVHPFCSAIGPGDCRIATRYTLHQFNDAFFSILHEVGHGLYEQGLDPDHYGTPMGEIPSLALHESQSRLWENFVGRSRAFWEYFWQLARKSFSHALGDVSCEEFYFAVNHVQPSLIRSVADEVTYNLHILVRFDLERALVAGDLRARDIPGAWNEAYEHYLGIVPSDDAQGCLQDGHWASGLIGYFPTYLLGNLYAAQLFAQANADLGGLSHAFARGQFNHLIDWLRDKVYRQGSRYPAARLIQHVTGTPTDYKPFVRALWRKYEELYRI
jgi:carboxypeptidase Taq